MTSPGLIDEGSFMHCSPYFVLMGCNPHWPEFEWPQHDHNGHQYVMECHHTAKKEQIVTHAYYVSLTLKISKHQSMLLTKKLNCKTVNAKYSRNDTYYIISSKIISESFYCTYEKK